MANEWLEAAVKIAQSRRLFARVCGSVLLAILLFELALHVDAYGVVAGDIRKDVGSLWAVVAFLAVGGLIYVMVETFVDVGGRRFLKWYAKRKKTEEELLARTELQNKAAHFVESQKHMLRVFIDRGDRKLSASELWMSFTNSSPANAALQEDVHIARQSGRDSLVDQGWLLPGQIDEISAYWVAPELFDALMHCPAAIGSDARGRLIPRVGRKILP